MKKYICKRLLMMIPVLLGISFVVFGLLELSPGDPAQVILGQRATPESIAALREQMGLNDPFLVRYVRYIANVLTGDFGTSYRTKLPVLQEILSRLPVTLIIASGAMVMMVALALPIGILSAVKQYSIMDNVTLAGALLLSSMPGFWLGTILILVFALQLGWLPAKGGGSFAGYLMPWFALAASYMATLVRLTRSNMLEVIRADYIKMARAKGASEKQVIIKHCLRNACLPIVTIIGMNFAKLIGGTMIIESVFALSGLGTLAVTAVTQLDIPMVMAEVLFVSFIIDMMNLLVDILYVYIDPRLKSQYVSASRKKRLRKAGLGVSE